MNSVWRSLLWKEWREQRWILAAIVGISLLAPAPFSLRSDGRELYLTGLTMMAMLFVPLSAMFVGVWIAAGEHSRRTIHFLQSLPTPMSQAAGAKLLCAAFVVVVPGLIALAGAGGWALAHLDELDAKTVYGGGIMLASLGLLPLSLMLWTAAPGANWEDEVRASAVSLLVIGGIWLTLVMIGAAVAGPNQLWPTWLLSIAAAAPGAPALGVSFADGGWSGTRLSLLVVVMTLGHAAVAVWYVKRFGRASQQTAMSPAAVVPPAANGLGWLAPPRQSPLAAIAWKQFRESAPIAAIGFAAILGLVAILTIVVNRLNGRQPSDDILAMTGACWAALGFAVAVVAGIGLLLDDLRPGLLTFWRSRPINVDQWFAAKLLMGLPVTVVTLAAAPLVVLILVSLCFGGIPKFSSDTSTWKFAFALAALHACVYLTAVAATALLRRAAPAALATILVAIFVIALIDKLGMEPGRHSLGLLTIGLFIAITATALAWSAVRNDWGLKGR
jgi:hypothetical protein